MAAVDAGDFQNEERLSMLAELCVDVEQLQRQLAPALRSEAARASVLSRLGGTSEPLFELHSTVRSVLGSLTAAPTPPSEEPTTPTRRRPTVMYNLDDSEMVLEYRTVAAIRSAPPQVVSLVADLDERVGAAGTPALVRAITAHPALTDLTVNLDGDNIG